MEQKSRKRSEKETHIQKEERSKSRGERGESGKDRSTADCR